MIADIDENMMIIISRLFADYTNVGTKIRIQEDRATAARLSPRTKTWHIYSASLTCKTIPCSAGLNIFYATYRLAGSYCCSLHKNLASECDEVLGSAALEEAYAGQVEPALKIILDLV